MHTFSGDFFTNHLCHMLYISSYGNQVKRNMENERAKNDGRSEIPKK